MTRHWTAHRHREPLAQDAIVAFHDALRVGDLEDIRRRLHNQRRLAHARNPARANESSLMVATTSPVAEELVDLFRHQNVALNARDDRRRNALLYACEHGAEWGVIEKLMAWSEAAGDVLRWTHVDENHRSALVLAWANGHVALARRLMEAAPATSFDVANHPYKLLLAAIESSKEATVLEVLEFEIVVDAVKEDDSFEDCVGNAPDIALADLIAGAIERDMREVVGRLHTLNPKDVEMCAFAYSPTMDKALRPEFESMVKRVRQTCIWGRIGDYVVLRHQVQRLPEARSDASALLMRFFNLPDCAFQLVLSFIIDIDFEGLAWRIRHPYKLTYSDSDY